MQRTRRGSNGAELVHDTQNMESTQVDHVGQLYVALKNREIDVSNVPGDPGAMSTERCASCGWPLSDPYEIVSRHRTSEGLIVYTRCVCGRLQVRRDAVAMPVMSSGRGAPLLAVSHTVARSRRQAKIGMLVASAVAAAASLRVPPAALVTCGALFVVVALLAWAWAFLTGSMTGSGLIGFALRAGALGAFAGVTVGALASALQWATLVALPVLYLVAGWWLWRHRMPRIWPCSPRTVVGCVVKPSGTIRRDAPEGRTGNAEPRAAHSTYTWFDQA